MFMSMVYLVLADYTREEGYDYPNNDISFFEKSDAKTCQRMCDQDKKCVGFVLHLNSSEIPCWTKSALTGRYNVFGISTFLKTAEIPLPSNPIGSAKSAERGTNSNSYVIPILLAIIACIIALLLAVVLRKRRLLKLKNADLLAKSHYQFEIPNPLCANSFANDKMVSVSDCSTIYRLDSPPSVYNWNSSSKRTTEVSENDPIF